MRKRPLFLWACVFLTGLAFARYKAPELIGILLVVLGVEVHYGRKTKGYKRMAGRSVALLSAFILGAFHMCQEESFRETYLSKMKDGDSAIIWGEISKIENVDYGIRIIFTDCYIHLEDETVPCNDVLAYTSSTDYQVGEVHKISGQINRFQRARNQGNFDSEQFYQSQKIDFFIKISESVLLGKKENWFRDGVLELKEELKRVYSSCLEYRTAGFYTGMILGDKSGLETDLKSLFTDGGIVHILAVSGLHVSIVGRGLYQFLRKCGIRFLGAGLVGSICLLFYCYMTGSGMSAERAVGMMLLFFLGQVLGKSYDMLNALGGVGILLLWENPFLLEYSGFWFSVMALVGIGFVTELFSWRTKLSAGLWASLGITLATLPITAFCYYEIPLYSPIINAILLPLLTPAFGLALVGGFMGIFLPEVATVILVPCHWCLVLFEKVCTLARGLPGAMLITGLPEKQRIVFYYILLLLGVFVLRYFKKRVEREKKDKKEKEYLPLYWHVTKLLLCFCCLFILLFPKPIDAEVTFLDVGQGDGIYLCMPDGTRMFIDGGSTDVTQVGTYRILPFLKSKQVKSIDYWFVTHADTDHISGLLEVLEEGYPVKCLVVAEAAPKDEKMMELLHVAESAGTKIIYISSGDIFARETWSIRCIYPGKVEIEDKNEASLVLHLETEGISALFTGDISAEVEAELIKQGVLEDISLYKVAHHGSKYSNSAELLKQIKAEFAVISCGADNSYGHPHQETLERLENACCEIWTTLEWGQITIEIENKTLVTRPHL